MFLASIFCQDTKSPSPPFNKLDYSNPVLIAGSDFGTFIQQLVKQGKCSPSKYDRKDSDEKYVIDLCHQVIGLTGLRQHRFDFLKGKRNLPVDVYYPKANLVIEYMEDYHDYQKLKGIENYDDHRRIILKANKISLLEIEFIDFAYDSKYRIIRRPNVDRETVKNLLLKTI